MVIHHIDNDPSNNSIENLQAVPRGRHTSVHQAKPKVVRPPVLIECQHCKRQFTPHHGSEPRTKFCGNNCKMADRRARGADNGLVPCSRCGAKRFVKNKYTAYKHCKACGVLVKSERLALKKSMTSQSGTHHTDSSLVA